MPKVSRSGAAAGLRAVDLFAGCGGLSLGFRQAGIDTVTAVELSPMAAETYFRNLHSEDWEAGAWEELSPDAGSTVAGSVNRGLLIGDVRSVLADDDLMAQICDARPDVLAGGPPCQGFSMAGRRNSSDSRNSLPWAFLDFVERINPRAVVMENVLGINRAFKNRNADGSTLRQLELALSSRGEGYMVQPVEVNARHFGVPQNRPRMMLIAVRLDALPLNFEQTELKLWRSSDAWTALANGEDPAQSLPLVPRVGSRVPEAGGLLSRREFSVLEAIGDLGESGYRWASDDPRYKLRRLDYARFMRGTSSGEVFNHQQRRHGDLVQQRFALYHFLAKHNAAANVVNLASSGTQINDARIAVRHALGTLAAMNVAGETFAVDEDADLTDSVVRLSTAKHSQRVASGNHPSPTVLTLPDDLVHPRENRIMTVRELARIQSFPDWYEFRSKVTTGGASRRYEVPQYSQVGNAIPPLMAQAIAECLAGVLRPESPHEID